MKDVQYLSQPVGIVRSSLRLEVLEIRGLDRIRVRPLEASDGTSLIDIKQVLPESEERYAKASDRNKEISSFCGGADLSILIYWESAQESSGPKVFLCGKESGVAESFSMG